MRRLMIGLCILGGLLALSWGVTWAMEQTHGPIAQQLHRAAEAADREDWATAAQLTQAAMAQWQRCWHLTAAVADHTPMDSLDGLFGELQIYLAHQEQPHFSATCRHLAQLAEAMADSHTPSWWNIV